MTACHVNGCQIQPIRFDTDGFRSFVVASPCATLVGRPTQLPSHVTTVEWVLRSLSHHPRPEIVECQTARLAVVFSSTNGHRRAPVSSCLPRASSTSTNRKARNPTLLERLHQLDGSGLNCQDRTRRHGRYWLSDGLGAIMPLLGVWQGHAGNIIPCCPEPGPQGLLRHDRYFA